MNTMKCTKNVLVCEKELPAEIEFSYQRFEPQTLDYPGAPSSVDIQSVTINDEPAPQWFIDAYQNYLEADCLEFLEETQSGMLIY